MKIIKMIFCKHNYKVEEARIVHYPDYEPHKVGIIRKCDKCGKEKRNLYIPHYFMNKFGVKNYRKIVGRNPDYEDLNRIYNERRK